MRVCIDEGGVVPLQLVGENENKARVLSHAKLYARIREIDEQRVEISCEAWY